MLLTLRGFFLPRRSRPARAFLWPGFFLTRSSEPRECYLAWVTFHAQSSTHQNEQRICGMVTLKDFVDDLGGGRSLALGSILVVCCYVAASRYVETVEERLTDLAHRVASLEGDARDNRAFHALGTRFTGEQGAELSRRIERLERLEDERRNPH